MRLFVFFATCRPLGPGRTENRGLFVGDDLQVNPADRKAPSVNERAQKQQESSKNASVVEDLFETGSIHSQSSSSGWGDNPATPTPSVLPSQQAPSSMPLRIPTNSSFPSAKTPGRCTCFLKIGFNYRFTTPRSGSGNQISCTYDRHCLKIVTTRISEFNYYKPKCPQ